MGFKQVTPTPEGGFASGQSVTFDVSSLAMTGTRAPLDPQDATVRVFDGAGGAAQPLGDPATVTNALRTVPDDEAGTATVTFTVPNGVQSGSTTFWLRGDTTGGLRRL